MPYPPYLPVKFISLYPSCAVFCSNFDNCKHHSPSSRNIISFIFAVASESIFGTLLLVIAAAVGFACGVGDVA